MDHQHMTEFASERYYQKLQEEAKQRAASGTAESSTTTTTVHNFPESQFILPIRGSQQQAELVEEPATKGNDQKQKGLFRGFRFKSHSKTSTTTTTTSIEQLPQPLPFIERRTSVAESTKISIPFEQLFSGLPNELQVQIISSLPLSDILSLRLASSSLHALISLNEGPITRYHLDHHIPAYAKRLYPVPEPSQMNFHYLCGLWHRLHIAAKLSHMMCEWMLKEIFLKKTPQAQKEFEPQTERMRRRLIPLVFTIFHFFETYRELHLQHLAENGGIGLSRTPFTVNPIEAKIMAMYDDQTLLRVHQVFPLVISSFCRRLRPPSYIGRVEKSLRGYLKDKPPDEVHVAILCIGGLRQVERFWEVKGYNTRRNAVDDWYNTVAKDPLLPDPEPKKRRGLMGLARKKSMAVIGKPAEPAMPMPPHRGSVDSTGYGMPQGGFIFNTSLSAGMPMAMDEMDKDKLKMLIPDLPVLQKIWLETAEAMILERKIVEHPADIKRNASVMMDLIRDDGIELEDEWLYGACAPESVRPNLDAIVEDDLE
ncbi:hypothetical protein GQ53DRAFT_407621 [Thozetella sp. PMI_491]|nr:hypothetical protein GQ53DRAFT_407621 [Thozetella sp. PMI_491]